MSKRKCRLAWWILGALGAGIVLSIGVYAIASWQHRGNRRDPRSTKVNELLKEAEMLIEMGKRGEYHSKRSRG